MTMISGSLVCVIALVLLIGMIMLASSIRILPEGKRLSIHRFGKHMGDRGPGIVFLIPLVDRGVIKEHKSTEVISMDDDRTNR